jgi:hypothetical protein
MKRKRIIASLAPKKVELDPIGYPTYPESEDIYNKSHKESNSNVESTLSSKPLIESDRLEIIDEKTMKHDAMGNELDIPGSELDDAQERIGSEDEENNYYSLGGDNHDDLEENKTA